MTIEVETKVITLADDTKVIQKFRTMTGPNGQTQVQASQPVTAAQLTAQITALQADLALLTAP
jgi:hypothetical protein